MHVNGKISCEDSAYLKWSPFLIALSLDKVDDLWEKIGLPFGDINKVKNLARVYVDKERLENEIDDNDSNFEAKIASYINDFLFDMSSTEEQVVVANVLEFVNSKLALLEEKSMWLSLWRTIFYNICNVNIELLCSVTKWSPEKAKDVIDVATYWKELSDFIDSYIESKERFVPSSWDKFVYEYYQRETPDVSPLDWLERYLKESSFEEIWNRLIGLLSDNEIEGLNNWGVAFAKKKRSIPERMVVIPQEGRKPTKISLSALGIMDR